MRMKRREFLAAGLALNVCSAANGLPQARRATANGVDRGAPALLVGRGTAPIDGPTRRAKTTRMFKSPEMYPNALAVMTDAPGGLWIGQQKVTPQNAPTYQLPLDPNRDELAWLVDWNGKVLKTVNTHSRNTSGMAYGNGCVWMGAKADGYGLLQVDLSFTLISSSRIELRHNVAC